MDVHATLVCTQEGGGGGGGLSTTTNTDSVRVAPQIRRRSSNGPGRCGIMPSSQSRGNAATTCSIGRSRPTSSRKPRKAADGRRGRVVLVVPRRFRRGRRDCLTRTCAPDEVLGPLLGARVQRDRASASRATPTRYHARCVSAAAALRVVVARTTSTSDWTSSTVRFGLTMGRTCWSPNWSSIALRVSPSTHDESRACSCDTPMEVTKKKKTPDWEELGHPSPPNLAIRNQLGASAGHGGAAAVGPNVVGGTLVCPPRSLAEPYRGRCVRA